MYTMENHQIKLIDSTYAVSDAQEVLIALLNDKIKFLNQQIFSITERFGSNTAHLKHRVEELAAEREKLLITLNKFKEGDYLVEIEGIIDIKVKESTPTV